MLTKLLAPLNRLIGSGGLIPLIKASPWLLIPILAYSLANNYLGAENERKKEQQTIEDLMSIADNNPDIAEAITYYLVKLYPKDKYLDLLTLYLDIIEELEKDDTTRNGEHHKLSVDLILNVKSYYESGTARYNLSKQYLQTCDVEPKILLKLLMLESDHHENGIDQFVIALTEDSLLSIKGERDLIEMVEPFLIDSKVHRKTRDDMLKTE